MRMIKIGIASIDTTVGAHRSNTDKLIAAATRMADDRCTVGVFQEEAIAGYPAEDLVQMGRFMERQWEELRRFASATRSLPHPTLFFLGVGVHRREEIYSCNAAVLHGRILALVPKEDHPTYGIFYGDRTYSRGHAGLYDEIEGEVPFGDVNLETPFGVIGMNVCEDIWRADGTMLRRCHAGAELFINVSASPYRMGVARTRERMLAQRSADNEATVVYANQVGGNDALVFDGGGYVAQRGDIVGRAPRWRKDAVWTTVVDLDRASRSRRANTTWRMAAKAATEVGTTVRTIRIAGTAEPNHRSFRWPGPGKESYFLPPDETPPNPRHEAFDDVVEALVMGLGDYFEKTGAFRRIGIALSGGKDSVLVACIARLYADRRFAHLPERERAEAIADFIWCFSMPSRFNSEATRALARDVAAILGTTFRELPIDDAFAQEMDAAKAMLGSDELPGNTLQNIQARIRGERMWNWSNASGGMWIQTSNKSEKSVGYTTVGGDMMGSLSLIADLCKSVIPHLLRHIARKYCWEPVTSVANSVSSAELKYGQSDEDDLMPFEVLDVCIALFAGEKMDLVEVHRVLRETWTDDELAAMAPRYRPGMLVEWVERFAHLFTANIFKWVLTPEAVHLSDVELDRERALQLPVVQSREWLELERFRKEALEHERTHRTHDE